MSQLHRLLSICLYLVGSLWLTLKKINVFLHKNDNEF